MGGKLVGERVRKAPHTCQFREGNKLSSVVNVSSLSLLLGSILSEGDSFPPLCF